LLILVQIIIKKQDHRNLIIMLHIGIKTLKKKWKMLASHDHMVI